MNAPNRLALALTSLLGVGLVGGFSACSSSTTTPAGPADSGADTGAPDTGTGDAGGGDAGCIPPLESCDQGSATMYQVDTVNNCILGSVSLPAVCVTSVNRCAPSAGVVTGCAFSPDGGVFIGGSGGSDNNMLTADGWTFTESSSEFARTFPANEVATAAQDDECSRAVCFPACPGAAPAHLYCLGDAGTPDSGQPDAGEPDGSQPDAGAADGGDGG